jgi:hypothetical protein
MTVDRIDTLTLNRCSGLFASKKPTASDNVDKQIVTCFVCCTVDSINRNQIDSLICLSPTSSGTRQAPRTGCLATVRSCCHDDRRVYKHSALEHLTLLNVDFNITRRSLTSLFSFAFRRFGLIEFNLDPLRKVCIDQIPFELTLFRSSRTHLVLLCEHSKSFMFNF